jgi:hypothetical protein
MELGDPAESRAYLREASGHDPELIPTQTPSPKEHVMRFLNWLRSYRVIVKMTQLSRPAPTRSLRMKTAFTAALGIAVIALCLSPPAPTRAQNLGHDVEGWDTNGFALGVHRSESLSDLIFTWECRPPSRYDAFNVRVRISDGREGQVEVKGGTKGSYREKNAGVGLTYTFLVQGCDKGTFGSKCTKWSQIKYKNVRH